MGFALVLPAPSDGFAWALLALGIAMGAQNAAMDKVGGLSVNLTCVTSTVFKIGQGLANAALGRPNPFAWAFFLAMWIGLILGTIVGAGLDALWGLGALAAPLVALITIAAASAALAARGEELTIRTSFEATRIGGRCLVEAYERLVPIARRCLPLSQEAKTQEGH